MKKTCEYNDGCHQSPPLPVVYYIIAVQLKVPKVIVVVVVVVVVG
jgi:hypothetical protein